MDSWTVALVGAMLAFAAVYTLRPPVPLYDPVNGVWFAERAPGVPLISWFGRVLAALGGALAGGALGLAWAARRRPLSSGGVALLTVLVLLVLLGCLAYLARQEWEHWIAGR